MVLWTSRQCAFRKTEPEDGKCLRPLKKEKKKEEVEGENRISMFGYTECSFIDNNYYQHQPPAEPKEEENKEFKYKCENVCD